MRIHHLSVTNFRGIKRLDWAVGFNYACLIGAGDSTKSTVLDAIELALSPRWNIALDDSDFYNCETSSEISIELTMGDLPVELKSDTKYGYLARGWSSSENTVHDEPMDGDELVLTLRLAVDSSLEPKWAIVNDREPTGKPISAREREKLGCIRLGDFLDRHFSWGRGSALSRLTDRIENISGLLAGLSRDAREALRQSPEAFENLKNSAKLAGEVGEKFGVRCTSEYHPNLDSSSVAFKQGAFSLHDGEIPLRRFGLGTRRLLAAAMQRESCKDGGVILIDEVEQGLEPHRVRHLVRELSEPTQSVFMTTHSPIVVSELEARQLRVVICQDGNTRVCEIPESLRPTVRKASEAFLARKVLVCEGRTEVGFCRHLDSHWYENNLGSFSLSGVCLAIGGGSEGPQMAVDFSKLGYDVALLADSDVELNPSRQCMEREGVKVFLWGDNLALESRIIQDLPWCGVVEVVELAIEMHGLDGVRSAIKGRLSGAQIDLTPQITDWQDSLELRRAIGITAEKHKKGWFKRVDLAEELGSCVTKHLSLVPETDLSVKLNSLRKWALG